MTFYRRGHRVKKNSCMHPRQRITINGIAMSSLSCLIGFFRDGHGQLPDGVKRCILEVCRVTSIPPTLMSSYNKERDQLVVEMLTLSFGQITFSIEKEKLTDIIKDALVNDTAEKNEEIVQFLELWVKQVQTLPTEIWDSKRYKTSM